MKNLKRLAVLMMATVMTVTQTNIAALATDVNTSVETVSENAIVADDDSITAGDEVVANIQAEGDEEVSVPINEENFPDEKFREFFIKNKIDQNDNGILEPYEMDCVAELVFDHQSIEDYKGIENFKSLKQVVLYYCNNEKTVINVSSNSKLENVVLMNSTLKSFSAASNKSIKKVDVSDCTVASMDLSNVSGLEELCISRVSDTTNVILKNNVGLDSLLLSDYDVKNFDFSECKNLTGLYVYECGFTSLDLSANTYLNNVEIAENAKLEKLDISGSTQLDSIVLYENEKVKELDLTANTNLTNIELSKNTILEKVIFPSTSKYIDLLIKENNFSAFDFSPLTRLEAIEVHENNVKTLDFTNNKELYDVDVSHGNVEEILLPEDSNIIYFACYDNRLKTLDVSKMPKLIGLDCSDNLLKKLDLTNNHDLSWVECKENYIEEINLSQSPITFPNSYCEIFPQNEGVHTKVLVTESQTDFTEIKGLEDKYDMEFVFVEENSIDIDEIHFKDEIFRNYVKKNFDLDNDDKLTDFEILYIRNIHIENEKLSSVDGVELFRYLESLYIVGGIKEIDLSDNINLRRLKIYSSDISSIDLSKNKLLDILGLENNKQLTSLDLRNNPKLYLIEVTNNSLKEINLNGIEESIQFFNCDNNELESMDLSKMINLMEFTCTQNKISEINTINNKDLVFDEDYLDFRNQKEKIQIKVLVTDKILEKIKETEWYAEQLKGRVVFETHKHTVDEKTWICDGAEHYQNCTVCGEKINVEKHTGTKVEAVPSTCKDQGVKEYYTCKCAAAFEDAACTKPIKDLESWKKDEKNRLPLADHKWDVGKVTTEPSFFGNGVKTYTCTVCNSTYTENIARSNVLQMPVKGKYDAKPVVQYLVSGNSIPKKVKYVVSDKKVAKVSSKGTITAKKVGIVKITVLGRGADKQYKEICSFDLNIKNTAVTKKYILTSLEQTVDLNTLVTEIPSGYKASFTLSKANAKKAIIDANGVLKPLKKGTITVKCTISDGKNVLKKTIKVSVKLPK